jgi:hypothetical protein
MDLSNFSGAMEALHPFYSLLGEAAATLLGLLFVSVTFNPQILDPTASPVQRRYAENIFRQFVFLLWISLVMLLPVSAAGLGHTLLLQSVAFLIWIFIGFCRSLGTPQLFKERRWWRSYLFSFAIYLGAAWAGFALLNSGSNPSDSFVILITVSFLSLFSALSGVWRLMTGRDRSSETRDQIANSR